MEYGIAYKEQNPSQRLMGTPLSGSALFQLLKQRYGHIDVSGLVEYLASELLHVPKLRSSKMRFSLLNVTSKFTRFGHGYLKEPPQAAWPANQHLLFTFSLTSRDYDESTSIDLNLHPSNNCSVWGDTSMDWATIGLNSTMAVKLGLTGIASGEVEYLYNIVGAVLKNLAQFNMFDIFSRATQYAEPLKSYRDKYLNKPLYQLMRTVPYPYWVFNKQLWYHCPNVLHPQAIEYSTVRYWFTHLNSAVRVLNPSNAATENLYGFGTQGRKGMVHILMDSVLSFTQAVKQGDLAINEDSDMLVPLILQGMIVTGQNKIVGDDSEVQHIVDQFNDTSVELSEVFSQPMLVAEKLLRNDTALANQLLGTITFEE